MSFIITIDRTDERNTYTYYQQYLSSFVMTEDISDLTPMLQNEAESIVSKVIIISILIYEFILFFSFSFQVHHHEQQNLKMLLP